MNNSLEGILPVLPTPFHRSGEVDLEALAALTDFAIDAGVSGVVYPGFASEVEHLTSNEREQSLSRVIAICGNRVSVVAGASASSVAEAVAHGRFAAGLGVNWLMIQPPKSIGTQATDVVTFLSDICAQLPLARIVLQNAPAPRGSDLSPQKILEVVGAVPQIAYVKEETLPAGPAITAILASCPPNLKGVIGGGGARYILDEYARGACAAMPAVEISDLHVELDKAWRTGNAQQARTTYVRTLPLLALQAVYRMHLTKLVMMRRGVLQNHIVRAPTPELDSFAIADIDTNLRELGITATGQDSADG